MENIIEVKDLKKSYGKFEAVKGINFSVKKGEIFGFLGPNGAGKSTTINMLCTMLKPSFGTTLINGFDIVKQQEDVRRSIGIIFQESTLDIKLTARENLLMHCRYYGVPKNERKKRIDEVLEMVDLSDRRDKIVETFSGGMKRRLEIARGLLHYPTVLFLDEPTIGLDPQTRAKIWDYIFKLKEREEITIFLTTHYMDESEICERIAVIDHGKLIALDTPDALKNEVGGDIIEASALDNKQLVIEINKKYGIKARENSGVVSFNVEKGNEFLMGFIKNAETPLKSINLRRPTLNDVFLNLTGRQIRDEELSESDIFVQKMKKAKL